MKIKIMFSAIAVIGILFAGCKGLTGEAGPAGADAPALVILQQGISPTSSYSGVKDTTIFSNQPSKNYGNCGPSFVGYNGGVDYGIMRTIVKFDITNALPAGAVIKKTVLEIYAQVTPGGVTVTAFAAPQLWYQGSGNCDGDNDILSGATWNHSITGDTPIAWGTAGAGGGNPVSQPVAVTADGWVSIEISAETARFWADNPQQNHGIVLASSNETTNNHITMYSSVVLGSDRIYTPRLLLYYDLL